MSGLEGGRIVVPDAWRIAAGDGFCDAVASAVEVRASRRKAYGDEYLHDELTFLALQVQNKAKRVRMMVEYDGCDETVTDEAVALDSLRDIICYAAFAIDKIKTMRARRTGA